MLLVSKCDPIARLYVYMPGKISGYRAVAVYPPALATTVPHARDRYDLPARISHAFKPASLSRKTKRRKNGHVRARFALKSPFRTVAKINGQAGGSKFGNGRRRGHAGIRQKVPIKGLVLKKDQRNGADKTRADNKPIRIVMFL